MNALLCAYDGMQWMMIEEGDVVECFVCYAGVKDVPHLSALSNSFKHWKG